MDGYVTIGTELNTKEFDSQIKYIESKMLDIEDKLKQADMGFEVGDTQKLENEYEKLGNQLIDLKAKQEKYNQSIKETEMAGFNKIKDSVDSVGNSIENVTKKVGRWALAIFGIRSAYMFVRQAMSTLSQYDDQMAVNIEYIRYLLASSLKPVIETIINLAYKLIAYTNYIAKAWFGVNLFANASTEAFQKQNKALGASANKAKELRKTLTGFDEMNVLQDTGDVGAELPSIPNIEDVPIPSWLQWIVDNKDIVIAGILGIAAALVVLKLGFGGLTALGIGLAIMGIVYAIEKLIDFLNDPTFENFIGILEGIAIAVLGVAIAVAAWPVAIAAAVAFVIIEIVKHFDQIMDLFNKLIGWLDKNVLGALRTLFGPVGDLLYAPIKFFVELAKGAFESFYGGIKKIVEGVMKIFKGDFWGGIKSIFGGLLSVLTAPIQGFLKAVKSVIPLVVGFFKQMWGYLKDIGSKAGQVISGAFKAVVNGVLKAIETVLNTPIKAINGLIKVINKVPGINIGKLSTFNLPRLAKGGIVNNPGPGVMMGSYIAGEKGPEAVIPLDDNTLDRLGLAFARHTVINATMINQMNGRVISRELQKINSESDFAYNR